MRTIAISGALMLSSALLVAQDRAKPRGEEPASPDASRGGQGQQAEPRREREESRDEQRARPSDDVRARRPRPDNGDSRVRVVPRPPERDNGPRGNDGLTDAERRHPRPDADRNWRERRYGWRDYPDYPWWYGRNEWYWFPYAYEFGWYDEDRYLDGSLLRPHRRYWSDDGIGFYWPFDAPPRLGCHWYWVPTDRFGDRYGAWRQRRWRYGSWRLVYLCVDGREYPW